MHFHTLTVLSAFVIYYMCDGSIASIASPIISLVTRKNEYEINALYLCPPLPLSKYIEWRAVKRVGGGVARSVEGCYTPFHFSEPYQIYAKYCWKIFPKYRSVGRLRFPQQAIVINIC